MGGCLTKVFVTRCYHNRDDRLRRRTLDDTSSLTSTQKDIREVEELTQPVQNDSLQLCDGRRTYPIKRWSGKCSGVELAQHGGISCVGREESHEVWVLPVREAGDDLGLDIGLDVGPFLSCLGRAGWKELFKVSGLDVGDDTAGGEGIVIVDDWNCVSEWCMQGRVQY